MKIRTDFWMKPIPLRHFDWSAVDDDSYDGHGSPIGHGATEAEAIKDLMYQLAGYMTDEEYAAAMGHEQRIRDAEEG